MEPAAGRLALGCRRDMAVVLQVVADDQARPMLAPPPAANPLPRAPGLDHHAAGELDRMPLPAAALSDREWIVCRQSSIVGQFPFDVLQMQLRLFLGIGDDPDVRLPRLDGRLEHKGERSDRALGMPPRPDEIHPAAARLRNLRQLRFQPAMHRRTRLAKMFRQVMPPPRQQPRILGRPFSPFCRGLKPPPQFFQRSTRSHPSPPRHGWHTTCPEIVA